MNRAVCGFRRVGILVALSMACGAVAAADPDGKGYACSVTVANGEQAFFLVQTDSRESAREVAARSSVRTGAGTRAHVREVHECIEHAHERFSNADVQRSFEQMPL